MTLQEVVALVRYVGEHVTQQDNGRHVFEGLDTHSWGGKCAEYHELCRKDAASAECYTLYAHEAKVISTALKMLDDAYFALVDANDAEESV